jgi:hypothetical protein
MGSMRAPYTPTYITIDNEECKLHAWHQGSHNQELLVLIAGGGGNGSRFNESFSILSTKYDVCTFDRRGNSDIVVPKPRFLNPGQQAHDVVAIIIALGNSKAIIFGTSRGRNTGLSASRELSSVCQQIDRPRKTYHGTSSRCWRCFGLRLRNNSHQPRKRLEGSHCPPLIHVSGVDRPATIGGRSDQS